MCVRWREETKTSFFFLLCNPALCYFNDKLLKLLNTLIGNWSYQTKKACAEKTTEFIKFALHIYSYSKVHFISYELNFDLEEDNFVFSN